MPNLYPLIRPILGRLPREAAHELSVRALEAGFGRLFIGSAGSQPDPPILGQNLWGLDFTNPIGLAAGYDKDARIPDATIMRLRSRRSLPQGRKGRKQGTRRAAPGALPLGAVRS